MNGLRRQPPTLSRPYVFGHEVDRVVHNDAERDGGDHRRRDSDLSYCIAQQTNRHGSRDNIGPDQWRWPNGFLCPHCGHDRCCQLNTHKLQQCNRCHRQTSITAGTNQDVLLERYRNKRGVGESVGVLKLLERDNVRVVFPEVIPNVDVDEHRVSGTRREGEHDEE